MDKRKLGALSPSRNVKDLRKQSYEDSIADSLKGAEPVDTDEKAHAERRVRGLARKMAQDIGNQGAREYLLEAYEDDDERIGWTVDELNKHGAEFSRGIRTERHTDENLPVLNEEIDNGWDPRKFKHAIGLKKAKDRYLKKRAL